MNKKAVAWGVIIGGIAAIVIIATLLTPLKGVWHIVGERIFGMVSPPSADGFVPGAPVGDLADYSARAFICAANTVAHGQIDFKLICPDSDTANLTSCPGVHYGPVCVDCSLVQLISKKAPKCKVIGFELPQDIQRTLAQKWIEGFGDPKYILYYESFPEGEGKYWTANLLSTSAVPMVLSGVASFVLGPAGGLGKQTSAAIKQGMGKQFVKQIAKDSLFLPFKLIAAPFKKFGKLYARLSVKKAARVNLINHYYRLKIAQTVAKGEIAEDLAKAYSGKMDDLTRVISTHIGRDGALKSSEAELAKSIDDFYSKNWQEFGFKTSTGTKDTARISDWALSDAKTIKETFGFTVTKGERQLVNMIRRKGALTASARSAMNPDDMNSMVKQMESLAALPVKEQQAAFKSATDILSKLEDVEINSLEKVISEIPQGKISTYAKWTYDTLKKIPGIGTVVVAGKVTVDIATIPLWASRDYKMLVILGTGFFAQLLDAQTFKYLDSGKDTVMLSVGTAWPIPYELKYENTPQLRLLKDQGQPNARFHLVSPCKADLTIEGDDPIVCYVQGEKLESMSLYNFSEGVMPARAGSIQYLDIEENMIKQEKALGTAIGDSLAWKDSPPGVGKTGLKYKKVGNVLYARDSDNNLFKIDAYTGFFFAVDWGREQAYPIHAAAEEKKPHVWHSGDDVGGMLGWQYSVIQGPYSLGSTMFAKRGSTYRLFDGYTWVNLSNPDLRGKTWAVQEVETEISRLIPDYEQITVNDPFIDYYLIKAKYDILLNNKGLFFPDFHNQERRQKSHSIGIGEPEINQSDMDFADLVMTDADNVYSTYISDLDTCIKSCGKSCSVAWDKLDDIIGTIVEEDKPLYYSDSLLIDLKKYQYKYWLSKQLCEIGTGSKYKDVKKKRDNCFAAIKTGKDFDSCKEFEQAFDEMMVGMGLNESHKPYKYDLNLAYELGLITVDPANMTSEQLAFYSQEFYHDYYYKSALLVPIMPNKNNEQLIKEINNAVNANKIDGALSAAETIYQNKKRVVIALRSEADPEIIKNQIQTRTGIPNLETKNWLYQRKVRVHSSIIPPDLIKYHHLATGEFVNLATDVIAARMYIEELKEKQSFRDIFVEDIHKANMLKDKCLEVPFNSIVNAYAPCKEAMDLYSKYAYADRNLLQMSLLFDYDVEVDYMLADAEEGIMQILDAPIDYTDKSMGSWAKELFRRLQRYGRDDPGAGCVNRGGIERRVPEWSDKYMNAYQLSRCRVASFEDIEYAWNKNIMQIHYPAGYDLTSTDPVKLWNALDKLDSFADAYDLILKTGGVLGSFKLTYRPDKGFSRALLDSLYFAGTTIDSEAVPYFDVREKMITDLKQLKSLKTVYGAIQVLNYLDFSGTDYTLTKDIVTDFYRRKALGIEREWSPSEIAVFLDQRNRDCAKASAEIARIGPLDYYYTNMLRREPAELCNNGYDGLYPAFLEAQLVPEFYSLRPGMTDFINFDHNQIPELRRLANDNDINDEPYPDLIVRKNYVARLSSALEVAEEQAFLADTRKGVNKVLGIDFGRTHNQITPAEFDSWISANKKIYENYNDLIDVESATKECEKPTGTTVRPSKAFSAKAITITPDASNYSGYNGGYNYCYSSELHGYEYAIKGVVLFSSLFLDPLAYAATETLTGGFCFGMCGRAVLFAKGYTEAYIMRQIDQAVAWPYGRHSGAVSQPVLNVSTSIRIP